MKTSSFTHWMKTFIASSLSLSEINAVFKISTAGYRLKSLTLTLNAAVLIMLCAAVTADAEEYRLDPDHSRIGFSVGHLGIANVKGRFTNYTGRITLENNKPESLTAEVTIQAESINTGNRSRDRHVTGKHFFNAEKHPEITFKADKTQKEDNILYLEGIFTMRGKSKTLRLPVTLKGPVKGPADKRRIGISAKADVNRQNYGVGSDRIRDNLVSDTVTLEIDLEAIAVEKK